MSMANRFKVGDPVLEFRGRARVGHHHRGAYRRLRLQGAKAPRQRAGAAVGNCHRGQVDHLRRARGRRERRRGVDLAGAERAYEHLPRPQPPAGLAAAGNLHGHDRDGRERVRALRRRPRGAGPRTRRPKAAAMPSRSAGLDHAAGRPGHHRAGLRTPGHARQGRGQSTADDARGAAGAARPEDRRHRHLGAERSLRRAGAPSTAS